MATRVRYSEIPPGTFVVVLPIGHRTSWTARVIEHRRWPDTNKHTGITLVECIDPQGFRNIRPGLGVEVETRTLTVGARTLAEAATALIRRQVAAESDTATADAVMLAIGDKITEIMTSVADNATKAARTDALEYALWAFQNHRHHANTPEQDIAWWATWNAIARHIDTGRCPDCNDHGKYSPEPGERARDCAHPHIYRWAGPNSTLNDHTDFATHQSRLGFIPSRWTTK